MIILWLIALNVYNNKCVFTIRKILRIVIYLKKTKKKKPIHITLSLYNTLLVYPANAVLHIKIQIDSDFEIQIDSDFRIIRI